MTPDTKTLLTYAANAAEIEGKFVGDNFYVSHADYLILPWCPHTDDGDSARLRTTLNIGVEFDTSGVIVSTIDEGWASLYADHNGDKNAALRWATLRLAAEIGRR